MSLKDSQFETKQNFLAHSSHEKIVKKVRGVTTHSNLGQQFPVFQMTRILALYIFFSIAFEPIELQQPACT